MEIEDNMSSCVSVHPVNPQWRLLEPVLDVLRAGGLIVFPTDTCYALGCMVGARAAQERLRRIRQLDLQHDLSLLFPGIAQLAEYAKLDDRAFALLRKALPGPYTFILPATKDVPRRLADPKKRSIGVRIPAHPICEMLLAELGEPGWNNPGNSHGPRSFLLQRPLPVVLRLILLSGENSP